MGKLLVFAMSGERKAAAETICRKLHTELLEVVPEDYDTRLGVILSGAAGSAAARGTKSSLYAVMPSEMAVFAGFDSDTIDRFLEEWKQRGLSPIELKAAATFTNLQWTPRVLYAELLQEHMSFRNKR